MSKNIDLENDSYYQKYLKYKIKYLKLKNQSGGNPNFQLFYVPFGEGAIEKVLASHPFSAIVITKPELSEYLRKINKCYIIDEITKLREYTNICKNIEDSYNLIIGVRDISNETFGVLNIYFKSSMIINWAVSDGGGKGRYLVEAAQHLAKLLGFRRIELAATPTSAPFWSHMGFISNPSNPTNYYKDI